VQSEDAVPVVKASWSPKEEHRMAKADEWFTNERWDAAEQATFFRRLARAKTKRLYYARAKAGYLVRTGETGLRAGIALLEKVLTGADQQDLFDSCLFILGGYYVRSGEVDAAIERFRRVLWIERSGQATRHTQAPAEFAFLALRLNREDLFEELVEHFEWYRRSDSHLPWWADYEFAHQAILARIAMKAGRRTDVQEHATRALAAVEAQFPHTRHPDLGNTLEKHPDLIANVRRLLMPVEAQP
jgi:hypothetical protein